MNRQEKEIQEFIMRLHEERRKEFSRVEHKYDPEHSNLNNLRLHLAESNSIGNLLILINIQLIIFSIRAYKAEKR